MYKVISIFISIFVSLQRGRADELQTTDCCSEYERLNISLPNCADIPCSYFDSDETYSPLDDTGSSAPIEYDLYLPTASKPPLENECHNYSPSSYFYRYDDVLIKFNGTFKSCFDFPPYYHCKEVTRWNRTGNLYIKCPCENTTECCPPGYMTFDRDQELVFSWECSLDREIVDNWEYLNEVKKEGVAYILLHNTFDQNKDNISNGPSKGQYVIVRSFLPDYNDSDAVFELVFYCNVEEINENNSREELVCRRNPFLVSMPLVDSVSRCLCIVFNSASLLVYILLPPLRTMKTTIILCQTFCYFIRDAVDMSDDLHFSVGQWQPTYTKCIALVYSFNFWDLAASFWSNVMSLDLALTFRGRGFNRGKSRSTFLLYSLYGWGGPLIITLVTATLGFWVELPQDFVKPDIELEYCWFHTEKAMMVYLYLPLIILSCINIPLLGYAVYNIIRSERTSDILRTEESGRHVGNKERRTRLFLYFNLALLICGPKWVEYFRLLPMAYEVVYFMLSLRVVRAIGMFVFMVCKKRVFKLLKKRLHF